jgi:YD repeat-containing protein
MHLYYDQAGRPMLASYNGTNYWYKLNLQGDVIGLLNASGTEVVSYTYDAWGKELTCTGTMASTLGADNPLRYRGYIYDTETGLYYLQARYYNPERAEPVPEAAPLSGEQWGRRSWE